MVASAGVRVRFDIAFGLLLVFIGFTFGYRFGRWVRAREATRMIASMVEEKHRPIEARRALIDALRWVRP